jgi:hypothetical protein
VQTNEYLNVLPSSDLCKHIIFVLTKVVGLGVDNPLVYQRAYLTCELEQLMDLTRNRRVQGNVLANQHVRDSFANGVSSCDKDRIGNQVAKETDLSTSRSLLDDDCPICFDRLLTLEESTNCHVCSASFHKDCIRRWIGLQQRDGASTCPNCRSAWQVQSSSSAAEDDGYVNLGALQGLSPVRDTSTYKRRRYGW